MANDFKSDNKYIYSTLYEKLVATEEMNGVSLVFGEENRFALNYPLPMVVMYPNNGVFDDSLSAYIKDLDVNYRVIWLERESFNFEIWAENPDPRATPQQDANEVNVIVGKLLSAFYAVRPTGYTFHPGNFKWQLFQDARTRRGRAKVINVLVEIPVLYETPQEATVTSTPVTEEIDNQD